MTTSQQDQLDRIRRRVMNVIGHELRTPISTVQGLARVLATPLNDQGRRDALDALTRNADRASRLLDDLLMAGGVDTALPVEAPRWNDLDQILRDVLLDGGHAVHPEGSTTPAWGRPESVRRCLGELIGNAAAYGAPGSMVVRLGGDESTVWVEVTSEATIGSNDVPFLFEPFYRGEAAVLSGPGIGLGLGVARALARHDGGDVTLAASDDTVTTTLRLSATEVTD